MFDLFDLETLQYEVMALRRQAGPDPGPGVQDVDHQLTTSSPGSGDGVICMEGNITMGEVV